MTPAGNLRFQTRKKDGEQGPAEASQHRHMDAADGMLDQVSDQAMTTVEAKSRSTASLLR